MALTVSLRRALLVLLFCTVSILTVLYWNQGGIKPQTFMNTFDRYVKNRADLYTIQSPIEKMWTYKCENDRCVRHHYLDNTNSNSNSNNNNNNNNNNAHIGGGGGGKREKRIPFQTCAMSCGGYNIWPHPTVKSMLSQYSLTFLAENDVVQLRLETPHKAVRTLYESAFELFVKDLRRIQRLEFPDDGGGGGGGVGGGGGSGGVGGMGGVGGSIGGGGGGDGVGFGIDGGLNTIGVDEYSRREREISAATHSHSHSHSHRRRHVDAGVGQGKNMLANGLLGGGGGGGGAGGSGINNAHRQCDISNVIVHVNIQKSAEVHLHMETNESYSLTLTHDKRHVNVRITSDTFFGARHALATLQQMIWFDDEDNALRIVSKAYIVDVPKFRYRGLMLDTSRHFFSVEAIKRTIAGMSYAKLNRFHWHITDSQSFPYVSKHYPELAAHGAYSDRETYTADEVREVSEYAQVHGVQVVPEIDAPAHAGNGWDWGAKRGLGDLALCINQQPWSFYCGEPPCGQLNPKNNHTYLILQRLYEELLNLTGPTDFFHLGGDEVNLECWSQHFNDSDLRGLWCDFTLNALARLKAANRNVEPKYVTVWSSGLTNTKCLPRSRFAVQLWGGSTWQQNYDLIDDGFNVIFSHVDAWYLDCGFGNWRSTGEGACSPYRTWQNVYKHRPWERMRLDKVHRNQVLGGEACLWTEQVDEDQLDNRLWPRSAALAERLWSDPDDEHDMDVVPQDVFKRMSVFRNRLVELGLKAEPVFPKYCAQNPGECI